MPDKKPDNCSASGGDYTLEHMVPGSAEADRLFVTLIKHHVAITSTLVSTANALPTFGTNNEGQPTLRPAVQEAMTPSLREAYGYWLKRPPSNRNVLFWRLNRCPSARLNSK